MPIGDGGYLDEAYRLPLGSDGNWGTMGPWYYTGSSRGDNEIGVQGTQTVTINGRQYKRTGTDKPLPLSEPYLQPGDFINHPVYGGVVAVDALARIPPESGFWNGPGPALLAMAAVGGVVAGAAMGGAAAGGEGAFGGATAGAGAEGAGVIGAGEGAFGGATAGGEVLGSGIGGQAVSDNVFSDVMDWWGTNEEAVMDWWGTNEELLGDLPLDEWPGINGSESIPDWLKDLKELLPDGSDVGDVLKGLVGEDGLGDLFGGSNMALLPALAAIQYAKNTAPFDTSLLKDLYGSDVFDNQGVPGLGRLRDLYGSFEPDKNTISTKRLGNLYRQYDPESLAYTYDVNTGTGRERLTSNLARRQLSGSSFGNADMLNYDTGRDLGRQQLINQGAGLRANIASGIADVQAKNASLYNQGVGMQADLGKSIADIGLRDRFMDLSGVKTQADIAGDVTKYEALDRQYKNQLYSAALMALSGGMKGGGGGWDWLFGGGS